MSPWGLKNYRGRFSLFSLNNKAIKKEIKKKKSVIPITGLFFSTSWPSIWEEQQKLRQEPREIQVDLKLRLKTLYKCRCHLCFPSKMSISDCRAQKPPEMPLQRSLRDSDTQRHRGAAPRLERPHAPSSLSTTPPFLTKTRTTTPPEARAQAQAQTHHLLHHWRTHIHTEASRGEAHNMWNGREGQVSCSGRRTAGAAGLTPYPHGEQGCRFAMSTACHVLIGETVRRPVVYSRNIYRNKLVRTPPL